MTFERRTLKAIIPDVTFGSIKGCGVWQSRVVGVGPVPGTAAHFLGLEERFCAPILEGKSDCRRGHPLDHLGNGLAKLLVIEPHVLLAILGAELDGVALATGMYSGFLLAGGAKRVGIYLENGYIFRT